MHTQIRYGSTTNSPDLLRFQDNHVLKETKRRVDEDQVIEYRLNGRVDERGRGVGWFYKKDLLMDDRSRHKTPPQEPIVAENFFYPQTDKLYPRTIKTKMAFRYGTIHGGHDRLLYLIENARDSVQMSHRLFEVLDESSPRCLYFDLDGDVKYREREDFIIHELKTYVEREFECEFLTPVIIRSQDQSKFSCHLIFPEIQFANHTHQLQYVPRLLYHLKDFSQELVEVVDRAPYSRFQNFRLPWAVKLSLKDGIKPNSRFDPNKPYLDDWKTIFAGYTNPAYRRKLPAAKAWIMTGPITRLRIRSPHERASDINCLYLEKFLQNEPKGVCELPDLHTDQVAWFQFCLDRINPSRADHWWSWFRLCGMVYRIMHPDEWDVDAVENPHADTILEIFLKWSSSYKDYNRQENIDLINGARGKERISGPRLLKNIIMFDNPNIEFPQLSQEILEEHMLIELARIQHTLDDDKKIIPMEG